MFGLTHDFFLASISAAYALTASSVKRRHVRGLAQQEAVFVPVILVPSCGPEMSDLDKTWQKTALGPAPVYVQYLIFLRVVRHVFFLPIKTRDWCSGRRVVSSLEVCIATAMISDIRVSLFLSAIFAA